MHIIVTNILSKILLMQGCSTQYEEPNGTYVPTHSTCMELDKVVNA